MQVFFQVNHCYLRRIGRKIVSYYIHEAPEAPFPQESKAEVEVGMPGFSVLAPEYYPELPSLTTLIRCNKDNGRLYVGNLQNDLYTYDGQTLEILDTIHLKSPPSDIKFNGAQGFDVLTMGVMDPSDKAIGQLLRYTYSGENLNFPLTMLDSLPRPVQFASADLNQDGMEDVVICGFGNHTGRLSWHENLGTGFQEHVLRNMPGARRAIIKDINNDGLPDVVVLMAQGQEGVFAYYNQGKGRFKEEQWLHFPPVYGSSDLQLVDFNGDGALDILYTNGDNADYSYSLKMYHGVRIFMNDGQNNFSEEWFYPMYGASRAIAADYDGDGDLDIAAISFFPDFENAPNEGFLYFENAGELLFKPYTFEASTSGRWLTLETGDVDQDGDIDIILGSFVLGPIPRGLALQEKWQKEGRPFLILQNQHKSF